MVLLIMVQIKKGLNSYRIRINKSSLPQLTELIKPYVIPSMLYKGASARSISV